MCKRTMHAVIILVCTLFLFAEVQAAETLKDAYAHAFKIGAALNVRQISGEEAADIQILNRHFNAITPENILKWEKVHPTENTYDFSHADAFVDLGTRNGMYTVGHVLVWHNQTPDWVFHDASGHPASKALLLSRLKSHIQTVVGRYKGRIKAWDVVNEALNEDGTMRQSEWYKILGDEYIAAAFSAAHEADPDAELIYNDYSIENPAKRAGVIALIKKLKAEGVPITTVGIQGHYDMVWPDISLLEDTITDFAALGVKVAITELDITVLPAPSKSHTADINLQYKAEPALNPYEKGLPVPIEVSLANRYKDLFALFYKHRNVIDRVTLWGINDANSWRNYWPVKGRTDYPLLFDRKNNPKPALQAVLDAAGK